MKGLGSGLWGCGLGFGFWVQGSRLMVSGVEFGVSGFGYRVWEHQKCDGARGRRLNYTCFTLGGWSKSPIIP